MLSHNINPVMFKLGFIQVTWYALVYILGFLVVLFFLLQASKKKEINLKREQVYNLLIISILGMLIGARVFHAIFWNFSYFLANPSKILAIWEGGLSFHGGLLGLILVLYIYSKKNKIKPLQLFDLYILPATLVLALGRIANFINQEIVGTVTKVSWCFNFKGHEGCRHPVQLYAFFGRSALFLFLLEIKNKLKEFKPGFLFWIFIPAIGLGRFLSDFLREDTLYHGLSAGQWFSLVMILTGIKVLSNNYQKDIKRIFI